MVSSFVRYLRSRSAEVLVSSLWRLSLRLSCEFFVRRENLLKYWVPPLIWMGVIFLGSTDLMSAEHTSRFLVPFLRWIDPQISLAALNGVQLSIRKLGHLAEYAILAALLWRGLRGTFGAASKPILAFSTFLVAAAFAASDEYHQSFVPARTASVHDVMLDCVSIFVTVVLCLMFAPHPGEESRNGDQQAPAI